jgi:hypothetical protein
MKKVLSMALLLAAGCLASASLSAAAVTPAQEIQAYEDSLAANLQDASNFLATPAGKILAFSAGDDWGAPPAALRPWHVSLDVGLAAGAVSIDKSALQDSASQGDTDLSAYAGSLPDTIGVPLLGGTLHLGLPGFLVFKSTDLGIRVAGLSADSSQAHVRLLDTGIEVRGNVFEAGLDSPLTLTLGLSVDHLKTQVNGMGSQESFSSSDGTYTRSGSAQYGSDLDSDLIATGLKATISRKLLFVTPYIGGALQAYNGNAIVRSYTSGTITATGPGGTDTEDLDVQGISNQPAPAMDARIFGGMQFDIAIFTLGLGVDYGFASKVAGANAQAGLSF